jgi:hypothetical protein
LQTIAWRNRALSVVLHLRVRYVSKAAILKGGHARVGRKSKSRLNSKGLDRLALRLAATVFPLRI